MPVLWNHHPNGSMMGNIANYGAWGGTVNRTRHEARDAVIGNAHFRATWTVATTADSGSFTYTNKTISPNTQYNVSFYMRLNISRDIRAGIESWPASGTPRISTQYFPTVTVPPNVWTRFSQVFTTPANTASVTVIMNSITGWPVGAIQDIDGVMVVEGTLLYDYFESRQKFTEANEAFFYRHRSGLSGIKPISEHRYAFLRGAVADPKLTTLNDLEFKYYSGISGLTPAEKYSLMDHKIAAWS